MKQNDKDEIIRLKLEGKKLKITNPIGGTKQRTKIELVDPKGKTVKTFEYEGNEANEADEFANKLLGK
jgi:hypothetical protein